MILNIWHMHRLDHGSFEQRKQIEKFFDVRLSPIGIYQAYQTGEKIGQKFGRDKTFIIVTSPYYWCLETVEYILTGLMAKKVKLYQDKVYVEDALRESQETLHVQSLDNFDKISYLTEEKLIVQETAYNSLEYFWDYQGKEKFAHFPETWDNIRERFYYVEKQMKKLAEDHSDKIVLWVSHGFCTELIRERMGLEPFDYYNYGSVNWYELDRDKQHWDIKELDSNYHR